MNKKIISVIIALLLLPVLTGCIEPVEQIDHTKPIAEQDSGFTLANPVTEMSRQELIEKTGIDLGRPEVVEAPVYSLIELEGAEPVAQLRFMLDGHELCLRAQAVSADAAAGDISGLYYDWEFTQNTFVARRYAVVNVSGETGYVKWIDAAPGIQYSLSMMEGANDKLLIELAEKVFDPVQGEAG